MKGIYKIVLLTLLIYTFAPSVSYAEGMGAYECTETKAVWAYEGADGFIVKNQWHYVWDCWYYFGEDGRSLHNTWAEVDGKWYYFDNFSIMLHDTTTPDGYTVGADGAWITE